MKERERERLSSLTDKQQSSGKKSLFEVFKSPDPPQPRDPNAFDADAWEAYTKIITPIILNRRFLRLHTAKPVPPDVAAPVIDWLQQEKPSIDYVLPEFTKALANGVQDDEFGGGKNREQFIGELMSQRKRFIERTGFSSRQYRMVSVNLATAVNMCAKHNDGQAVCIVWEKMKEAGVLSDERVLHTLLHICSTRVVGNRRRRSPYERLVEVSVLDVLDDVGGSESVEADDHVEMVEELAIYHDLLFEPTEQSVGVRVKLLVAQGKAKEAERLLDNHSTTAELRLRAYTPVLLLHVALNDVASALKLYKRMRGTPLVHIEAETYVQILSALLERGYFAASSPAIGTAKELGYSEESGPGLFDQIVAEMAENVIEIPEALARRLQNALAQGFPSSNLPFTSTLEPLKASTSMVTGAEPIASRVRIHPSTGVCPRTGVSLRLICLSAEDRVQLKSRMLTASRVNQMWSKNVKGIEGKATATEDIEDFLRVMDKRRGNPFTAIVDGPNVGYFMQNSETGAFSIPQIKMVVDSLERLGERPLVVLPMKYAQKSFRSTQGHIQYLSRADIMILEELRKRGMLCVVPRGILDDFFLISASVSDQTTSRQGRSLTVATDNPEGRWPGERPVLVTNDQMRDHKIAVEPLLFRRWYSNHVVNYSFPAFVNGECSNLEIKFRAADAFSREIQSNQCKDGATVWHFPLSETENEWFCLRLPKA